MATTVFSTQRLEFRGGRLLHDIDGGKEVAIGPEPIVIGRDPACGLVIQESGVSSMHAELMATPSGVRLRDLGSKNGTWVGDLKISEAFLTQPTTFWVARTELRFEASKPQRAR